VACGALVGEERLALFLVALALGDVAQETDERSVPAAGNPRDRQLDSERISVAAARGELETALEDVRLARLALPAKTGAMRIAVRRRNDDLGHLPAKDIGARIAEEPLRRRVELGDRPVLIDRDDGIK